MVHFKYFKTPNTPQYALKDASETTAGAKMYRLISARGYSQSAPRDNKTTQSPASSVWSSIAARRFNFSKLQFLSNILDMLYEKIWEETGFSVNI